MNKSLLSSFLARLNFFAVLPPVALTGNLTLTADHNGATITLAGATPRTVTVPVGLPSNFKCTFIQLGTGAITVSAGAGATVTGVSSFVKTAGANAKVTIDSVGLDTYALNGAGSV